MATWEDALEKAQQLSDRCDAFFKRRADRRAQKDARRAAKDECDPMESYQPPDIFDDTHLAEERSELRTGSLGKGDN
jgi:hypothetical protein